MNLVVGKKIKNYPQKNFSHAAAAIDVVLLRIHDKKLQVLLLELDEEPFIGLWALPGGLVSHRESLDKAALRHLNNKVGLQDKIYLEQLYSFGDPDRDPLGWVVAVAFLGLINKEDPKLKASDRYKNLAWHDVKSLPDLAYDHKQIIDTAVKRLVSKVSYTNIVQFLMPKEFTLTELQSIYELLLGQSLDKRNFRKKILALNLVKNLNKKSTAISNRPAELFCFTTTSLKEVNIL